MNYRYKAVFFDFDGTFADTGRGIFECLDYACDSLNKPRLTPEQRKKFVGPPLFDSFRDLVGCNEEEAYEAIRKYREKYNAGSMLHLDVYKGIPELIDELGKAGIKVAICSSKPAPFIRKILDSIDMQNKIDFISCPEFDMNKKSKSEMINDAVAFFGMKKSEVVMVGDRLFDINGAEEAGVESIGAAYGYGTVEELRNCGADYIALSVSDVKAILFSQSDT